jgi:hypothetical protein
MSASAPGPRRAWRVTLCICLVGVLVACATAHATGAQAHRSASGPLVSEMVVGRFAVLRASAVVNARARTVSIQGRRCAVGAGTPLAALIAAGRIRGQWLGLRDYGHCGAAAVNSAQLFVNDIGGERNHGQDGWVYKVGRTIGSTGAADTSGPLGDGHRLRSGQQLVWFWCTSQSGGCQHSLGLRLSSQALSASSALTVTVIGYDDQGRGTPVAGARVTLAGGETALTSAAGVARLQVGARPGRYTVSASRTGMVPSFPETLVVR